MTGCWSQHGPSKGTAAKESEMTPISFLNILSVTNWSLLASFPTSWLKISFRNVPDIAKSNVCRSGQFRIKPSDSIHCRPLGFVSYFPAFLFTICKSTPATVPISFLVDSCFLFLYFWAKDSNDRRQGDDGRQGRRHSQSSDQQSVTAATTDRCVKPTIVLSPTLFLILLITARFYSWSARGAEPPYRWADLERERHHNWVKRVELCQNIVRGTFVL